MSSLREDLDWEDAVHGASHGGPWPAFVDLFAATALIVLVFFAVIAFQYRRLEADDSVVRSQLKALHQRLDSMAGTGSGFSVDPQVMGVLITLEEDVSFPQNRSSMRDLKDTAQTLLRKVGGLVQGPEFRGLIHEVEVVGHADSTQFAPESSHTNWEISAARAATVAQFLVEDVGGFDPCRVVASGRGEYYPRDRSKLPARARTSDPLAPDRRVEILLRPVVTNDPTQVRPGCRGRRR